MKNTNNNEGKGNGVATFICTESFNKGYVAMFNKVVAKVGFRWKYTTNGSRLSGCTSADYVSQGMVNLLESGLNTNDNGKVTYNGNQITFAELYNLWVGAANQKVKKENEKAEISLSYGGTKTKVSVCGMETTNENGETTILSQVENKAVASESVSYAPIKKVQREILKKFNTADRKGKKFWNTLFRIIRIETSKLPVKEACKLHGYQPESYYMVKKRTLADDRISELRELRKVGIL